MSYATLDDLKQWLGSRVNPPGLYDQLTDRVDATTADDAVGQEILDAAHGEVNGWIARRYAVPVDASTDATSAQQLKGVTLNIAEYKAWASNPVRKTIPERVADNYATAVKWLTAVTSGKAALPGAAEIPAATINGPKATAIGHEQRFTEDALKDL